MIFAIIHLFVNIFADGLSDTKAILFVLYLPFLIIIYLATKKHHFKTLKWKWFGFSLLTMYLYGLGLYLFHALSNHIPLTTLFVTGRNDEVSASVIWHNHVAKAVIAQVSSYFGKIKFSTADAGGAYLGIVPGWIFLLGAGLLIILMIQAVLYFATSFKKLLEDKNTRQRVFLILGYAIISFTLIKTSIDGGICDFYFDVTLVFIILFILRERKKTITYNYFIISLIGLGLLYANFLVHGHIIRSSYIASLLLLYNVILYASEKKIKLWALILLSLFFAMAWWLNSWGDRIRYNYSITLLPAGRQVYFYNEKDRQVEIYKVRQAQSIGQLAKKLNKNINYLPIAPPNINCSGPLMLFPPIRLISSRPLTKNALIPSKDVLIKNDASSAYGEKWQTDLKIWLNPCLIEILPIMNGELKKNNINDYLLIPRLSYDNSNIR